MYETIRNYVYGNHVLVAVLVVAAALLLYQIRFLVAIFFISYLIVIGFLPITRYLKTLGVPNLAAALIPYAIAFSLIVLVIAPFFFKAATEFQNLVDTLATYWEKLPQLISVKGENVIDIRSAIQSQISSFAQNLFSVTGAAVGIVTAVTTTITLSIYAQIDYDHIRKAVIAATKDLVPDPARIYDRLETDLGAWVGGQVILCVIIGVMSWLVLTLLNVPFSASLALLAGMLELLPTVGPIIAAVPAILIALQQSFPLAIAVTISYIGIQLLENAVVVPRVMGRAVNLHPIVIIPALIVGYQFLGLVGAILAIPALVMARILWTHRN